MAEETKTEPCLQSLVCLLCLDMINDATALSCGHTFCRMCLERYDGSFPNKDHLICPQCKELTQLSENRIKDLPSSPVVNGLIDEYDGHGGEVNAIIATRLKCTACQFHGEVMCLCSSCNKHMCEKCLECHQHLNVFRGHTVISVEEMILYGGSLTSWQDPSRFCSTHVSESKNIFCENCARYICLKCVIDHRDHTLKQRDHFEGELQKKVNNLSQRTAMKKAQLQKNIKCTALQRPKVRISLGKLRQAVNDEYHEKATQLKVNHQVLVEEIDALEQDLVEDLNSLKESDRQRIRSMCSAISLVSSCRLGCLETNSLSTHTLLCEELESMMQNGVDKTSLAAVAEKALNTTFQPSGDSNTLTLGDITTLNALHKYSQLNITRCVNLLGKVWGITTFSRESIAIGYWGDHHGIDIIDSAGNTKRYTRIPPGTECRDLVFQEDDTLYASTGEKEVRMYSAKGYWESTITIASVGYVLALNRSPSDEIIIVNGTNNVYIYDSTGSKVKHTVQTKHGVTLQASATSSGLIVASCSRSRELDVVVVYDRDGNAGKPVEAPKNVCLYAAVDREDRVYVAGVDCESGKVKIICYALDGLELKEMVNFKESSLVLLQHGWCCLVSLSRDKLAFACDDKLYFITVNDMVE
eukprot:XP_011672623.1 PREDICTED: probable E3 ubiquitin-protein ligase MID2 [Strongylocentrotus purpuratus]